ncbi:isoprenylcysteine carboxylmethyltransferase family protein [uncultured Draconibacterium sp.]|uniref:methyltransferase family protein n=1 Tax=uncultured Draconibacterium sp. TaxID=1573823 RepID=UPI0029C7114C|nr:isoprenylcysteine carboxylmethyltransferase family protein [uncultured Draconibacterium sp.]
MEILKIVPFISFLAFAAILYFRVWQLQKKGIRLWSKQRKKKQSMYLLFPLFGLLLFVWLFEVIRAAFQFSTTILPKLLTYKLIESIFPEVFGTVLVLFSLVLFWVTLNHFNTSLRFGLAKNNKGKLVTSGIFSMSRNPFFLSLGIYFLGVVLILPCLYLLVFTLAAFVGIHCFILKEERFMYENYGEEYNNYAKTVRRYF